MCKVLAITNVKNIKIDQRLLNIIKNATTEGNDHGFGYAVLDDDGSISGERTIRVNGFVPMVGDTRTNHCPIVIKPDNKFGDRGVNPRSLIAHGRFSTNSISLENTHPFVEGNTALIHNGVVDDPDCKVESMLKTNNDTEILLRYWQLGKMEAIEKNVTGYYACVIFDDGILHIMRDSRAPLFLSYVKTIDSYIIATSDKMIHYICKHMKWKQYDKPEMILDNCYTKFDGNNILEYIIFSPKVGYNSYITSQASNAFNSTVDSRPSDWYDPLEHKSYYERDYDDTPPLSYKDLMTYDDKMKAAKEEGDEVTEKDVYDLIVANEKRRAG